MSGFSDSMKSADEVDISLSPAQQKSKQITYTFKCSRDAEKDPLILCGLSKDTACKAFELEIKLFKVQQRSKVQITIEKERT